jgi:hypothetical protein
MEGILPCGACHCAYHLAMHWKETWDKSAVFRPAGQRIGKIKEDAASGRRQELTSPGPIGNRLPIRFPATKSFGPVGASAAMAAKFLKTGTNCWLFTKLSNHGQRF